MKVVERLQRRLPWFLTFSPVSSTIAHLQVVAKELQEAEAAKKLVQTIFMPRRPIRLWRRQNRPKEYSINFDIALEDIRRVKLYEDHECIFDSGVMGEGVHKFEKQVELSSDYIIPQSLYRVEVEDYYGNVFEKGIPENDEIRGNAFDIDLLLDLKGKTIGCARYTLREADYRHLDRVYPPYHDQRLEPDYYYEKRMDKYLKYLREKGVIFASIFKFLGTEPTIEGFWRQLCEQNVSFQNEKYMATKNMNSALFLISADVESLPINIRWDPDELEEITQALSPSKKFEYVASVKGEKLEDSLEVGQETLKWTLSPAKNTIQALDSLSAAAAGSLSNTIRASDAAKGAGSGSVSDPTMVGESFIMSMEGKPADNLRISDVAAGSSSLEYSNTLHVSDSAKVDILSMYSDFFSVSDATYIDADGASADSLRTSDAIGGSGAGTGSDSIRASDSAALAASGKASNSLEISDGGSYSFAGYIRVFDTDTEFQQMTRSGTIISGTGAGAVLTVPDPTQTSTGVKRPTSASNVDYSNCSYIGYWYKRSDATGSCNSNGALADTPAQACYTDILRLSGFSFGVPSNATIRGIEVTITRRQSGTVNRVDQLVRINVGGSNSTNKADTSTYWPKSYTAKTYGGSTDLWGLSPTPSNINTLYLDISAKNNYSRAGATFYVDCVGVNVYYTVPTSGTASYTLSGSAIGVGNNLGTLTVSCSIPQGSISYTVKKNGSVVKSGSLSSGTNNIDLTSISVSASSDSFDFIFGITSGGTSKPTIGYIKHYLSKSKTF